MTSVPQEASAILRYTPESLANLPVPPVFLLKAGSRREKTLRDEWLADRRARYHQPSAIRAQIERGLSEFWDAPAAERFVPIVRQYWDARDQFDEQLPLMPDDEARAAVFAFEVPDGNGRTIDEPAIEELLDRLADVDDRYNRMLNDNRAFIGKAAVASAVFIIAGWEGLETPYARAGGCITDDCFEEIAREIRAIEENPDNALIDGISLSGTALMQLLAKCSERMFLTELARKNSQSPSRSSASQPASKMAGAAAKRGNGSSRRPGRSKRTPAT